MKMQCMGDGNASQGYICPSCTTFDKHSAIRDLPGCNMYAPMFFVFAFVLTVCSAADPEIPIVSQTQDGPNPDGSYKFAYESGNGIKVDEEGAVADAGSDKETLQVKGSVSYKGDDGKDYALSYTADGEGFKPVGDHLPTPPPIPDLIKKALEWIAAHPSEEDKPRKA